MNMIIEDYQRLSSITEQMRNAAAVGEWDDLIELEKRCSQEVENIKPRDGVPTDEVSRKQKADLIRKMLADDKAIRSYTEPWMRQLERIMQSARSEQRLQNAYLAQG
ncbi:MAG: flagellar protein FliT [Sideroxydans sp.]